MEEQEIKESRESITLTKNAKGTYQWIIKIKDDILTEESLKRLEDMDSKLQKQYGQDN